MDAPLAGGLEAGISFSDDSTSLRAAAARQSVHAPRRAIGGEHGRGSSRGIAQAGAVFGAQIAVGVIRAVYAPGAAVVVLAVVELLHGYFGAPTGRD